MFVFGAQARAARPFGLPGVLALMVIGGAVTLAVRWHPDPRPAATPPAAEAPSCTRGPLTVDVFSGGSVDLRHLLDAELQIAAEACGSLTAHDPDRGPPPTAPAARTEAQRINVAVEAVICPYPSSCREPRDSAGSDVIPIRRALHDLGYPRAEVRLAEYPGEAPESDVVYGVALHSVSGCLVSYARIGQGVAPMGPVGTLDDGRCLHAAA